MTDETEAGQPLTANRKAHTMIIEVLAGWGIEPSNTTPEQLTIATTEALCRAIDQQKDLHIALADLLHAVCGERGFAEAVRRDSGRIYPWPALELAEAKARAALDQSK